MAKRTPNYVLVLLMFIVSGFFTYWANARPAIALTKASIKSIPSQIKGWVQDGDDIDPGKDVLAGWSVTSDNFLIRNYVNSDGNRMSLMLVYKGRERRNWHLSEMCFSGSGYNVKMSYAGVPYVEQTVNAVKLEAENNETATKDIAVYFFVSGKQAEGSFLKQQLLMATNRLHPSKYGWAFVRVTSPVITSKKETMKAIRQFLKDSSDEIAYSLTSGTVKE